MRQVDPATARIEVVAAVIVSGGRIFCCRRAADRSAGLKWEFPGGKVERGESPRDALVRELREELDVVVNVGELIHRGMTTIGETLIELSCFAATLAGAAPERSTDHDQLGWFLPQDLISLDWAAPDIPAVHEVVQQFAAD
ncbi:(deoxy)nucleoside triphosphate pyrophosphohydrolase [Cryobacterium tepidiphilum]|uniref:8-oxo-dGTP diphosphatase n=1 Tax=Cryobacterium tepidiphilum TaxID=2486026 RepID=A0A3M8LFI4_9MICO|nr:(deoxy)nucleoside triphosphate pyrophosphohydrolase [Cryobacterium tepidiphilum]RNE64210.1 (deoxy)nucleoside triphosphate pyrophosphohydrolase [Cryobacterium tepidiphilum]